MSIDSVFTADSSQFFSQFTNTLAYMHSTMGAMQPILERQTEIIQAQRFLGNAGLLVCLIATLVVLVLVMQQSQKVKLLELTIKKRFVLIIIALYAFIFALFNIIPGAIVMDLQKDIKKYTVSSSKQKLFSDSMIQNLKSQGK